MVDTPKFKNEFNVNTIVTVVGFLITLAGGVTMFNRVDFRVDEHSRKITSIEASIEGLRTVGRANEMNISNLSTRMVQVESGMKSVMERIDRYLADNDRTLQNMVREVGVVSTQVEVLKQVLARMEAQQTLNPGPRSRLR